MQSGFVEKLPCELTRDEKLSKAEEMAASLKVRAEVELEAKSKADEFKSEMKRLDRTIGDRAEEIRTGVEYRQVECTERGDYRRNQVSIIRLDTGEVVRQRPMRVDERQDSLFASDEAPSAQQ
jgi:uncharacterized FlaG/YvyC family protein